ncbi:MAG: hypothetical protein H7839_01905 [Magnetococcus sp. YQC-5]
MDRLAHHIINKLQSGFPICPRPFAVAAAQLGMDIKEETLIQQLKILIQTGFLTRFGPFFHAERMGGGFTLAAMRVPQDQLDATAELVNAQPEIAHNYARDHELNMWFVVATEHKNEIDDVLKRIESLTGLEVLNLPKLEEYRLGFQVHIDANGDIDTVFAPEEPGFAPTDKMVVQPDALDRALIAATQAGLPLEPEPYHRVAESIGEDVETVCTRLQLMLRHGWIRRIGAATNHYRLGLQGNGMSVWNVPDDQVTQLGRQIGALNFVTHCYRRPRHLPSWPYNLFAMVHGPNRQAVENKIALLSDLLGPSNQGHLVLHSTRILKKTGLRLKNLES